MDIINKKMSAPWQAVYLIGHNCDLLPTSKKIMLIFREQNCVADLLAKEAHVIYNDYFRCIDLCITIQKCLFFDCIGLPAFRSNSK